MITTISHGRRIIRGSVLIDASVDTAKLAVWAAASNITTGTLPGSALVSASVTSTQLAAWAAASNITTGTLDGSTLIDATVVYGKLSSALQTDVTQSIATYSNLSHLAKNSIDTVDYMNNMYAFFYAL